MHDEEFELIESMHRLETNGIAIAVFDDGRARFVNLGAYGQPAGDGFAVYSPADMLLYGMLSPHERRLLHELKKRFGGTVEWRRTTS